MKAYLSAVLNVAMLAAIAVLWLLAAKPPPSPPPSPATLSDATEIAAEDAAPAPEPVSEERLEAIEPPDIDMARSVMELWKRSLSTRDPETCLATLAESGLEFERLEDEAYDPPCARENAVSIDALGETKLAPAGLETRCAVAGALQIWAEETLQPAAEAAFGVRVAAIQHYGSYACRRVGGAGFWSQHAIANAIDISGFELEGGRVITVKDGWSGAADEAAFLRAVRDGACARFRAVLGPDADAAHEDHFHFDLGWARTCE